MATTMRTASVTAFGQPLAFPEWPMPQPHLDLHPANSDWPRKPTLPFIPGHEEMVRVAAPGVGVTRVDEGDRLGVPSQDAGRGHFEHCLQAWETVCGDARKFSVGTP